MMLYGAHRGAGPPGLHTFNSTSPRRTSGLPDLRNRHRGAGFGPASPATPPGMRVRTGRFVGLRLAGKPGDSQLVEEAVRQRDVERHRRVVPPASAVGSNPSGGAGGHAAGNQLAIHDPSSLPVLE